METTIMSMNTRGLGNRDKRAKVFEWLKEKHFSIYLLQETHSTHKNSKDWSLEWGGKAYFSGTKSNSEGVAILFHPEIDITVLNITHIIEGRLLAINVSINNKDITIINIYGPNNDDVRFFETLEKFILDNNDKHFILGGDFNRVINNSIDKK